MYVFASKHEKAVQAYAASEVARRKNAEPAAEAVPLPDPSVRVL